MIAEAAMLNLKGHIDNHIPQFIGMALDILNSNDDLQVSFKIHLIEMVSGIYFLLCVTC